MDSSSSNITAVHGLQLRHARKLRSQVPSVLLKQLSRMGLRKSSRFRSRPRSTVVATLSPRRQRRGTSSVARDSTISRRPSRVFKFRTPIRRVSTSAIPTSASSRPTHSRRAFSTPDARFSRQPTLQEPPPPYAGPRSLSQNIATTKPSVGLQPVISHSNTTDPFYSTVSHQIVHAQSLDSEKSNDRETPLLRWIILCWHITYNASCVIGRLLLWVASLHILLLGNNSESITNEQAAARRIDELLRAKIKSPLSKTLDRKQGVVYIFKDKRHEGRLKVGFSAKSAMSRIKSHFDVIKTEECNNARRVEQLCLAELSHFQDRTVVGETEFFVVSEAIAQRTLQRWVKFIRWHPYDKDGKLEEWWKCRLMGMPGCLAEEVPEEHDVRHRRWRTFTHPNVYEIWIKPYLDLTKRLLQSAWRRRGLVMVISIVLAILSLVSY